MKISLVDYFYLITPSNWYRDLEILTGTKCGRFTLNTLTSNVLVLPADDWSRGSLNDPLICINSHIMQDFMDRPLKKPKLEWTFSPLGVTYMIPLELGLFSNTPPLSKTYREQSSPEYGFSYPITWICDYTVWGKTEIYLWQYVKLISK